MIENPSFMQHDCIVAWLDLIDEVSCPKHPDACLRDKVSHMFENIRTGFDIQSNRRLVKQKHARAMQQCARDFHPSHLPPRKRARLVVRAVRHRNLVEDRGDAQLRFLRRHSVQGRVIGQVLQHRQIKVERPRLENDAQSSQRFAGSAVYIETANAQRALLGCIKPGDKTKQCCFAGAIEAKKDSKSWQASRERRHCRVLCACRSYGSHLRLAARRRTRRLCRRSRLPVPASQHSFVGDRHAPRKGSDGDRFQHFEAPHIDHRNIV